MGNYFNQSREGVHNSHSTTVPAAFFKSRSGSKKASFAVLSLTNCARGSKKKLEQWRIKDKIRLKDKTTKDSFDFHLSLQYFSSLFKSAFFIQPNKAIPILFVMVLLNPISVWAATYYISPSGSNSNSGASTSSPWKTFTFAIPRLRPGDTLILMDGTYNYSNSGYPEVDCSKNAANGTSTLPITIIAQYERQAFIQSDGSVYAFAIGNCSYWNIQGLHMTAANNTGTCNTDSTMRIYKSSHINVRRNLIDHQNDCCAAHQMLFSVSNNSLAEENEFYNFEREALEAQGGSTNITMRRNYSNGRNYHPASCYTSNAVGSGPTQYYSNYGIVENNITENTIYGFDSENTNTGNQWLGNIALNNRDAGFKLDSEAGSAITNNTYINNAAINSGNNFYMRSGVNSTIINGTSLNNKTSAGVVFDKDSSSPSGNYSAFATNTLSINATGSYGFYAVSQSNWGFDHTNAWNNAINYSPHNSTVTNSLQIGPQLEACMVYIPAGSPMKGAGKNGADIGANIIYRYEDGVLTNQKLWDQNTGQFPCGAVVSGVNDVAGSSCIDVNQRLNVGVNGCPIP